MPTMLDLLMAPMRAKGLVAPGNIPLWNRPEVKNPAGGVSTVYSMSFGIPGPNGTSLEVLVPKVVGGRILSDDEAMDHYFKTGEHLGIYNNVEGAEQAGQMIHRQQELSGPLIQAMKKAK